MGISALQKPDKIFLENTNMMYALSGNNIDVGNLRETFFANQLSVTHKVNISPVSDFIVDDKFTFEIGGNKKGFSQMANVDNSFVVADNLDYGVGGKIPLWQFGFLY